MNQPPTPADAWSFLPLGYLLTVLVEVPILLIGLAPRHRLARRLVAGLWLTACTYPVVVMVLPYLIWQPLGEVPYLLVAETFAPVAECLLFWSAFGDPNSWLRAEMFRDLATIVVANLASFGTGELLSAAGWL